MTSLIIKSVFFLYYIRYLVNTAAASDNSHPKEIGSLQNASSKLKSLVDQAFKSKDKISNSQKSISAAADELETSLHEIENVLPKLLTVETNAIHMLQVKNPSVETTDMGNAKTLPVESAMKLLMGVDLLNEARDINEENEQYAYQQLDLSKEQLNNSIRISKMLEGNADILQEFMKLNEEIEQTAYMNFNLSKDQVDLSIRTSEKLGGNQDMLEEVVELYEQIEENAYQTIHLLWKQLNNSIIFSEMLEGKPDVQQEVVELNKQIKRNAYEHIDLAKSHWANVLTSTMNIEDYLDMLVEGKENDISSQNMQSEAHSDARQDNSSTADIKVNSEQMNRSGKGDRRLLQDITALTHESSAVVANSLSSKKHASKREDLNHPASKDGSKRLMDKSQNDEKMPIEKKKLKHDNNRRNYNKRIYNNKTRPNKNNRRIYRDKHHEHDDYWRSTLNRVSDVPNVPSRTHNNDRMIYTIMDSK